MGFIQKKIGGNLITLTAVKWKKHIIYIYILNNWTTPIKYMHEEWFLLYEGCSLYKSYSLIIAAHASMKMAT